MKEIIIDRLKAIESYKSKNNIFPKEAFESELLKAVIKQFNNELEILKADGIVIITGRTVNMDNHLSY